MQKERDSAEQGKLTASTLIVKLGGQQQRDASQQELDTQAYRIQIASLEAENRTVRQANEDLNGRVQHDAGELERLMTLLNGANTATGRAERALGDLTAQRAVDATDNDILRRQLAEVKEEKDRLDQNHENLQLQLSGVLSTVEVQRRQLALLEETSNASGNVVATLKQQILDMQEATERSSGTIASLKQQVADLQSTKHASDTTIIQLEAQHRADQVEIGQLQSTAKANADTIARLNTQISTMQDTISSTRHSPLPSAIKKEQEEAVKELANLKKQREKDAADLERLRSEKERLEGELEKNPSSVGPSTAINVGRCRSQPN